MYIYNHISYHHVPTRWLVLGLLMLNQSTLQPVHWHTAPWLLQNKTIVGCTLLNCPDDRNHRVVCECTRTAISSSFVLRTSSPSPRRGRLQSVLWSVVHFTSVQRCPRARRHVRCTPRFIVLVVHTIVLFHPTPINTIFQWNKTACIIYQDSADPCKDTEGLIIKDKTFRLGGLLTSETLIVPFI